MPFTPFHMGPGMVIKALLRRSFSLVVFGWTQILLDLPTLLALISGRGPLHGFTHTCLGAAGVAVLAAWSGKYVAEFAFALLFSDEWEEPKVRGWVAALSAVVGASSHVALDSIMHPDVRPLAPFSQANPLFAAVSVAQLYTLCVISGVVGLVLYFAVGRIFLRKKTAPSQERALASEVSPEESIQATKACPSSNMGTPANVRNDPGRPIMRAWRVLLALSVLLVGWGMMWGSLSRETSSGSSPRPSQLVLAPKGLPPEIAEQGDVLTVRFLPAELQTVPLAEAVRPHDAATADAFLASRREKLILVPDLAEHVTEDDLASGRLPQPGQPEVLAGRSVRHREALAIAGQQLRVVGILRNKNSLFWNTYLLPESPASAGLFAPTDPDVVRAVILPNEVLRSEAKKIRGQGLLLLTCLARLSPDNYYLYVAGLALLLLGGSALLIGGLGAWARHAAGRGWLGTVATEIVRYRSLLVAVHGVYFGLVVAGSVAIYQAPDIQDLLLTLLGRQIGDSSTMLGIVGDVYRSGNIPLAAAVTLGVNFFAGSLAVLTLPSLIVPGSGALFSFVRASFWGVLLAPSVHGLAGRMIAHSFTLLLEGEGYILAAFFGMLVPLYLIRSVHGPSFFGRWWGAIKLNLKGNVLVLLVLAIAALYEAAEVILLSK